MSSKTALQFIQADWPAAKHIKALTTTRSGGASGGACQSFNLAMHVDDNVAAVNQNRAALMQQAALPAQPVWLQQVHSKRVVCAHDITNTEADGSWTNKSNVVCAVMTADCLPVFFCDKAGTKVAIAHAGWRGLHAGIISETFFTLNINANDCLVWLGPAIGPKTFEVGAEVYQQFISKDKNNAQAFKQKDAEHWLCDLYQLARMELEGQGITQVHGGDLCTYTDSERFYSFRRDGQTGRMASLIWLEEKL